LKKKTKTTFSEEELEENYEIGVYKSNGKRNNRPVFRAPCGTPFLFNPGNTKHYIYGKERDNIEFF